MADSSLKVDPAAILTKLEATSTTQKAKVESGSGGWWATLIIFLVGIAAAVVWWYIDRKNRAELAKLRHEKQVALIQAEQSKTDKVVEKTVIETEELRKARLELAGKVLVINHDIDQLEVQRAVDKLAIDRIRTWNDLPPPRGSAGG